VLGLIWLSWLLGQDGVMATSDMDRDYPSQYYCNSWSDHWWVQFSLFSLRFVPETRRVMVRTVLSGNIMPSPHVSWLKQALHINTFIFLSTQAVYFLSVIWLKPFTIDALLEILGLLWNRSAGVVWMWIWLSVGWSVIYTMKNLLFRAGGKMWTYIGNFHARISRPTYQMWN